MTVEEFKKCKHFDHWGFVPPLDISKGGRYVHVTKAVASDLKRYDIFADENMNLFFWQSPEDVKRGVDIKC